MSRKFKNTKGDLSENPPSPEHLLRGFHGRGIRRNAQQLLPVNNFENAYCLGRSNTIFYLSDKRDPKDPKGEGAQGFMKRFYHEQNPESYLYVVLVEQKLDNFQQKLANLCSQKLNRQIKKKGLVPPNRMPKKLVELGILEKVDLSIGKEEFELAFEGYHIYVWDDMQTLMALPIQDDHIIPTNLYIWVSKHTKVNWRGIID